MFRILNAQLYLPAQLKFALKPFYRKIFPNRLHILLYPTSRCNYKCSYCPVVTKFDYSTVWGYDSELSGSQWVSALAKLPPAAIYVAGGEPFLYRDLPEIVNELPKQHSLLGIVTNLSVGAHVYRRIKRRIHLNASFHREFVSQEDFVDKIRQLKDAFHICVNVVATPENLPALELIQNSFKSSEIELHVDPYVMPGFSYTPEQRKMLNGHIHADRDANVERRFEDFSPKRCSAGRNYINVAADGSVYTCAGMVTYAHSPLYADITAGRDFSGFKLGNLLSPDFRLNQSDVVCAMPCVHACDRDAAIIKSLDIAAAQPIAASTGIGSR
jgi:MoaA/NifB/PqqE/SkfB family radical SAM enzyme